MRLLSQQQWLARGGRFVMSEKPTKKQLADLYAHQRLSLAKISQRYGVCTQTILNWMRKYKIPRRTLSQAWQCKTEEGKHLDKLRASASRFHGKGRWNWVPDGTRRVKGGYVYVKCTGHPRGSWVFEHILVMERHLGRHLESSEVVHHRNRNKTDNRLANLQLFANHSEHLRAVDHRKKEVG